MNTHLKHPFFVALATAALCAAALWPEPSEAQTAPPAAKVKPGGGGSPVSAGDCDGDGTADSIRKPALPPSACPNGRCSPDSSRAQAAPGPKVSCHAILTKGTGGNRAMPVVLTGKIEHSGDPHEYLGSQRTTVEPPR